MYSYSFLFLFFFFFKQKTAYEMRISDWSSDVCSSDLLGTAITVATLIGVFLPGIVLKLWRRPAQEKPLRAVAIFTALAAVPILFLPFATTAFQAYAIATVQGEQGIAACALMPGLLQDLAPPPLRAPVLAALTIAAPFALATPPIRHASFR